VEKQTGSIKLKPLTAGRIDISVSTSLADCTAVENFSPFEQQANTAFKYDS